MSEYYPIMLKISGKKCLVVGGGNVAERKTKAFLECGGVVHVISPNLSSGLSSLAESRQIEVVPRDYRTGDLKNAAIVVAATDDQEVNKRIYSEGQQRGILTNVVDDPENSNFIVPSILQRDDVIIAVSTSGRSPALARKIRTELEEKYSKEYASLAILLSEVRSELKEQGIEISNEVWQEAIDMDLLIELLRRGESQEAKDTLLSRLQKGGVE